jgi:CAAX prenyl protease-like protein
LSNFSTLTAHQIAVAAGLGAVALLSAANYAANHLVRSGYPRFAYTVLVVLAAGTIVPALALKRLVAMGVLARGALAFSPWPLAVALAGGLAFLFLSLRDQPAGQLRRVPKLLVALFAPSLAEVLVFAGIVFSATQYLLTPWIGHIAAAAAAVAVTSLSFGTYHLTHAAPWNSLRMVGILLIVWLFIALFYALTGNLWATALLNTLLATVGFVRNRVTRPEEQPVIVSAILDVAAVAAVSALVLRA